MTEDVQTSRGKRLATQIIAPTVTFFLILGLWQLAVDQEWVGKFILPPPADVAVSFYELLFEENLWPDIWATSWVTLAGFFLGCLLGVALALACGLSRILNAALYPYIVALQVTPRIALAPIIIAWLGFGAGPKIAIVVLVVFFPVFVNTLAGIYGVDRESSDMFRSLGANRRQTFTGLMLPSALPVMFAGFKTAMTFALLATIVAEFISADAGLGLLVSKFSYQLNMDDAFAVIIMLAILGMIFYALMVIADRCAVYWMHDSRMSARTRRLNRRRGTRLEEAHHSAAGPGAPGPIPSVGRVPAAGESESVKAQIQ
jgi:NitT/TauT family transport system permease protein